MSDSVKAATFLLSAITASVLAACGQPSSDDTKATSLPVAPAAHFVATLIDGVGRSQTGQFFGIDIGRAFQ
jgi:hypothetical protein